MRNDDGWNLGHDLGTRTERCEEGRRQPVVPAFGGGPSRKREWSVTVSSLGEPIHGWKKPGKRRRSVGNLSMLRSAEHPREKKGPYL